MATLNSNPSEWETGESDPGEFTAGAVAEVVKTADEEEVNRIGDAEREGDDEERSSVVSAVDARLAELSGGDDESEDQEGDGSDDVVEDQSEVDPTDDRYNPYQDPAVPSSALADVIVSELRGGKSPTLDACRKAYKEQQKG